jgi:hypothetical protein
MKICLVDDCPLRAKGKGFCEKHLLRFRKYGDPLAGGRFRTKQQGECKVDGCVNLQRSSNLCSKHIQRLRMHGDLDFTKQSKEYGSGKDWYTGKDGYVLRWAGRDHPNATGHGNLYQHRDVMANIIKRPLQSNENVHHVNGDRSDNRAENLELWSKNQPAGQRVEDKVLAAARLIIMSYDDARKVTRNLAEFDQTMASLANTLRG